MELNNTNAVMLASAARTAVVTSEDITNSGYKGCHIIIDVTADPASASITPTIQGLDSVSGKYYTLLAGNAISAVGTTVLRIYPGLVASANVTVNDIVPNKFRVSMAVADTDSITYSVAVSLVK